MASYSVSKVRKFVEGVEGAGIVLGVDVHKNSYHSALRREDGRTLTWVGPADPRSFVEHLLEIGVRVDAVAYEAGPTGFSLCRMVEAAGLPCIVAAPSKIPRPVSAGAKTDRLDCIKLAEYAARGMLRPIAIPTMDEETERTLMRRRHRLVDCIRKSKQHIKALLLELGIPEPEGLAYWTRTSVDALHALCLKPMAKITLESYLRELAFQHTEMREVECAVQSLMTDSHHAQAYQNLQSVPGVGFVVASTFMLELFRPERFQNKEQLAAYLGLAPTVRHSGEKTPRGRLVPVGQKRLRSLLVEAAWIWRSRDEMARELYNRVLSRTGLAQKAITALARRLAIILWRIRVEGRAYRPPTIPAS